jgi:hypothetical protein
MALVKYNDNSISAVTSTGLATGSLVPIKTLTASGSASLSFVHGSNDVVLDSTYPIYKFEFINCHPSINNASFNFQGSTDGGSNYNTTMTTTWFYAGHSENDSSTYLTYGTAADQAQGTAFQKLSAGIHNNSDDNLNGTLEIFNPSSSTFVKHFISRTVAKGDESNDNYIAGYFNTTNIINAIRFQMSSGNIDSGKIKLYGIKDS